MQINAIGVNISWRRRSVRNATFAFIHFLLKNPASSIITVSEKLTISRILAWLVGYHSLVSQFSRLLIGLLGYRGATRAQVPSDVS